MIKYIKISNLTLQDGTCDYKGLDIMQFVAGTQLYPTNEDVAYIGTTQDTTDITHHDLEFISEEAYEIAKEIIASSRGLDPLAIRVNELEGTIMELTQIITTLGGM